MSVSSGAVMGTREIFRPDCDVIALNAANLRAELKNLVANGVREVAVDLSRVEMVDSAGIGLLIATHNSLKKSGGSMELIHVAPEIGDLFRSMRMHQHFRISAGE